ncbi:MAG: hypothetical protein JKY01_02635 [Pseudomonadales bacterium]|nr:hypothetical protein [Pseudomonadales bacterium]
MPDNKISDESIKALEIAKDSVKKFRKENKENTSDLDHLLSRLGNLQSKSIGSNLAEYVKKALDKHPDLGDSEVLLPKIKEIYNARSALLHTGKYDNSALEGYIKILSEFVPSVLKAHFRTV